MPGRQGQLLGFAGRTQLLIEHPNEGIAARGDNRCHVELCTHPRTPAPDIPLAAQRPTIPIDLALVTQRSIKLVNGHPDTIFTGS